MTLDELKARLRDIIETENGDPEIAHGSADKALLEYIDDKDVSELFDKVERWYA